MSLRSWIRHRWMQGAPAAPSASSPDLFGGQVYQDDPPDGVGPSSSHFERYRSLIDTFDEERETPFEKGVRSLLLMLAYLLPLAAATALRRETEERQDMHMKEARSEVWLELDRLHAQALIADAKRRMLPLSTSVDELPESAADAPGAEQVQIRRIDRRS